MAERSTTTNATVTLLFTDLVDGTELLGRLGEDGAQTLRRAHFDILREAISDHGGQEVKIIGDGLMVVFPSAVDAVACATAALQSVSRHNRRRPDSAFEVRLGLNVGEPTREGEDYFGLPVVIAKRLCDTAAPGQVLVSDVVRALVGPRTSHRFRALEPRDLKGVGITAIYEVTWEPAEPQSGPLPAPLVPAPDSYFVGRATELARLDDAWRDAVAGNRRAVLIGGEPGVGKTRLAAELAGRVHGAGGVLYGRCDEDLGVPYQPIAEALRASVAACGPDELARRVGRASVLTRLVPELQTRLPDLPPQVAVEMEAERYLLFEAVADYLAAASEDQPLLLVLDDLHWAAKPTLVLLRHLLRSTVPMHVLIVGTFRDTELDRAPLLAETLADLRRDADVDRVSLSGLDRASVAAFVEAAGYEAAGPRDLAEVVHAGTEGNPFFVGEVLRHFKESGDADLTEVGMPPGVKDVVLSRLTRLTTTANSVLSLASVIGPRFELALLERLAEASADALLDALDEAVRARVLVELPVVGQFTFAHALIRQVLIDELTASRRARIHWRITEALETLPDAAQRVEELAFHAAEAGAVGDVTRAADYALAASRDALERYAYEPAVELSNLGLAVLARAPSPNLRARAELHLARAQACDFAGDTPAMKAAARLAADDARSAGWTEGLARAAVLYGRWAEYGVADPDIETLCREALDLLPESDLTWRARVHTTLANYRWNGLGEGAAAVGDLAEESLTLARQADDADSLAWSLYLRATTLVPTDDLDRRLELAEELVALSRGRDDPRGRLDGLIMRATTRLERGDVAGFEADADELEALGDRLHWWAAQWWSGNFRITRAAFHGDLELAEELCEHQFKQGSQDANAFTSYASQVWAVRRDAGRLRDFEPIVSEGVSAFPTLPAFRAALALSRIDLDRPDEARADFDVLSADDFAGVPDDTGARACIAMLSEIAASLGAADRADALASKLRTYSGHLIVGGVGLVCFGAVDRYLAMLADCAGRSDEAGRLYAAAASLEEGLDAGPALARTRLWWGRHLLASDPDSTDGRRLLTLAADGAHELGMAVLVRQARETLDAAG